MTETDIASRRQILTVREDGTLEMIEMDAWNDKNVLLNEEG